MYLLSVVLAGRPAFCKESNLLLSGILVNKIEDWEDAIITLSNKDIWKQYSQNAYNSWIKNFSYKENLLHWKQIINI